MKKITVDDLIKAIRKNGYKQGFGSYIYYNYDKENEITSACAIGQAALNLGVKPEILNRAYYALSEEGSKEGKYYGLPDIVYLNDRKRFTLEQIADELEKWAIIHKARKQILDVHD